MKEEICFIRRSMLLSLPVLRRVVMANVAMLRFESVTRFSRSRLQAVTADGCFMATCRGRTDTGHFTYRVGLARGPLGTMSTPPSPFRGRRHQLDQPASPPLNSYLIEGAHSSIAKCSLGRATEKLEHCREEDTSVIGRP